LGLIWVYSAAIKSYGAALVKYSTKKMGAVE